MGGPAVTVLDFPAARVRVGGSTIAAAAGISPWCSRVELYYRLTGVLPEPDTEALWWGKRVQPLIFDRLREDGYTVQECPPEFTLADDRLPWLEGHPDGIWSDDAANIVEAKLSGGRTYRHDDPLPIDWQAQVQTYMRLGDCDRALVAVCHAGTRLDVHEVHFDERAASRLVELAGEFVAMVEEGVPPPPDGSESARKTLGYVFPAQTPGKLHRLLGASWEAYRQLREWREAEARCKERVQALENTLKAEVGDAETVIGPHDEEVATWKQQTARRIDTKRLRAEHPEIAASYETEIPTRVWRLK